MRLTDHTDYSLRVLMYLNQEKRLITLNELAEKLDISKNNLIKVSNQLAKFGFIETTKGRTGGLLIKEGTSRKTIADIIKQTEESFYMAECFSEKRCECTFLKNCQLKVTLKSALRAFMDSLAKTTIDDVTPKKRA
ncbi:RrF2 family transcriptional regulator [Pseudobdellovibrio sp. HCB154]|uniref:RrF2 family transcriptional regulator n=1 Tax=Pseudobdellovibrio sp. HCB154 TaxID=3386277 RepID=UPI0039170E10